MNCNVIRFPIIPRRVAHDVTETDLASRIRSGLVTVEEIQERFERSGFAEWMQRQGLDVWKKGLRGE